MYGGDEVSAVVIDMGSTCTKAGYAGEDSPKYVIPSSIGVLGGEDAASQERRPGTNALAVRADGMRVTPAVTEGIVTDWGAAGHGLSVCSSRDLSVQAKWILQRILPRRSDAITVVAIVSGLYAASFSSGVSLIALPVAMYAWAAP